MVENGTFSISFQPFLTHYLEKNGIKGDNLTFMDTNGAIIRPEDPVDLKKGVIVFAPGESVKLVRLEEGQFRAADASQQLDQLGQQLDNANKGFFIGSSAFRTMRKAFRDLKKDFPTLNDFASEADLRPAVSKLQKMKETAEAYLRTKQLEPPFEYNGIYAKNDREKRRIDAALEAYRFADRQLPVVNQLIPEDEAFDGRASNAVTEKENPNDPALKLRIEKGKKVVVSQEKELYPGQNKVKAFVKSMETIRMNAMGGGEDWLITVLVKGSNKQNEPFETTGHIRKILLEVSLFPVIDAIQTNYDDGRCLFAFEDAVDDEQQAEELLKWAKGFDNLVYNTKVFLAQAVPDEMVEKMLAYVKNPDDGELFTEINNFTENLKKTMDAYRKENADIPNIKRIGSPETERDFSGMGNDPVINNEKFLG